MHARLLIYRLHEGTAQSGREIMDTFAELMKDQEQCRGATFFINETEREFGGFFLWPSQTDAEKAEEALRPRLLELLEPVIKWFEVYEPAIAQATAT